MYYCYDYYNYLFLENHLRIGAFRCLISVFNSELPNDEKELLIGKKTDIINLCLYLFKVSFQKYLSLCVCVFIYVIINIYYN